MSQADDPKDGSSHHAGVSSEVEHEAAGFDDPNLKTSPEVLRPVARSQISSTPAAQSEPVVAVASQDPTFREQVAAALHPEPWTVIETGTLDGVFTLLSSKRPQVVLVDMRMQSPFDEPIPLQLRARFSELSTRIVALIANPTAVDDEGSDAMEQGYDDFIVHVTRKSELLARCRANLSVSRLRHDLNLRRQQAASLLELGRTLASSLDLKLLLHTVSKQIADYMGQESCSIVLLDTENRDAVVVASSADRAVRDLRIQLAAHPDLQLCVEHAEPIVLDDTHHHPSLGDMRSYMNQNGIRTCILFPILFEERVTGVLRLRSTKGGRHITDDDLLFGQSVAASCAVAIRNAHLFDSIRDHTERMNYMRRVAERQMEALKKYEDFFEYAAEGMAIVSTDAAILYVNKEGRRLLGAEKEELRESSFLDFVGAESQTRWQEIVGEVGEGQFRRSFDFLVSGKDGSERIFWLSAGGVGQDTGLIILSFRDVTETREMEMELRTTKEFLENLIDNSVDAIVAADMTGTVILFNKGAELLFGHSADQVIGHMHVANLYPDQVAQEIMRKLRDPGFGGRGRLEAQRNQIQNARGEVVPVSMTASLIEEDGEEVATVGMLTDLRERLKIEERLSQAQEELLKTEKARVAADLAGMAAHELNQPLTSVLGYAEMLRHRIKADDVKTKRCVDTIYSQAERMAEIVRKIGRITKHETKHYGARTTMMDLDRASAPEENTEKHQAASHSSVQTALSPPPRPVPAPVAHPNPSGIPTIPPRSRSDDTQKIRRDEWLAALAAQNTTKAPPRVSDIVRPDSIPATSTNPGDAVNAPRVRIAKEPDTAEFEMDEFEPELEPTNPGIKLSTLSQPSTSEEKERSR